jgi:histidinol-phosphatase (PHP family)
MIDFHVHTGYCGHAVGEMEDYVRRAVDLDLDEFGFTDHFPYPEGFTEPAPNCSIPRELFGEYLSEARRLRDKYSGRIAIRVGAEFDYLGPDWPVHPYEEARRLGLDHCLCSLHLLGRLLVDYSPEMLRSQLDERGWDIDRAWDEYFDTLLELAGPGFCTAIGHFDLVKKFCTLPGLAPGRDHSARVDRVLDKLARSGTAIEVNTSGWDKPCGEQYPSLDILRRAVARGIPLTAGSDSHSPGEVGRHFDRLLELLRGLGVKKLVRFEKLSALPYNLPD